MPDNAIEAEAEILALRRYLKEHDYNYYVLGVQVISDSEYDRHYDHLLEMEQQWPQFDDPKSPTKVVGGGYKAGIAKLKKTIVHDLRMYSLHKSHSFVEVQSRFARAGVKKTDLIYCNIKGDGLPISIQYEGGRYVSAAIRGNGIEGDDVSHHAHLVQGIPKTIPHKERCEIHGEVVLTTKNFNLVNGKRIIEENEEKYATRRNAASGILCSKSSPFASKLIFYAFNSDMKGFVSHSSRLESIKKMGFFLLPYRLLDLQSLGKVIPFHESYADGSSQVPVDGTVYRLDDLEKCDELGFNERHPRFATCWKFEDEVINSQVTDIEYTVGMTGAITPVVHFSPVELNGVTVSKANLGSVHNLESKGISVGHIVGVVHKNMATPQITEVISRTPNSITYTPPTNCPECNAELIRPTGSKVTRCINPSCPGILESRISHFVSDRGLNIKGIGPAKIKEMISTGKLSKPLDIFKHTWSDNIQIQLDELKVSLKGNFVLLLKSLGIGVNENVLRLLAGQVSTIDELIDLCKSPKALKNAGVKRMHTTLLTTYMLSGGEVEIRDIYAMLSN